MKHQILPLLLCSALCAQGSFSSDENLELFLDEMEIFHQEYVSEQGDLNSQVNLGDQPPIFNPPANPFSPPGNPPAPAALTNYLPIVLVNNSGQADSDIYITLIGSKLSGTTPQPEKMYMTFNPSSTPQGKGSYTVSSSGQATNTIA